MKVKAKVKVKCLLVGLALLLVSTSGLAATKIDPMFSYIKFTSSRPPLADLAVKMAGVKTVGGRLTVGCLIKTTDIDRVSEEIERLGGRVRAHLTTVVTADMPLDAIDTLAALDDVVYIEAAKRLTTKMNYARNDGISNVVSVQDGTGEGLTQAYDGTGTVVGLYDSGVDCSHADFTGRIVAYKDMGSGKEYTSSEIAAGDCNDSGYHGTHVAGIAAGANSTYKGVAPGASIIVAEMSSGSNTEVIEGLSYIFGKADALSAPAVANLSVGTSLGPHDGTSTFETGIDELVSGKEGRAIVCAAGNETVNSNDTEAGYTLGGLHAGVNVSGTDIGYETIMRANMSGVVMDIWLDEGSSCNVELAAYDSDRNQIATTGSVGINNDGEATKSNLTLGVDFSTDTQNANNGKQHPQAWVSFTSGTYNPVDLTYDLIFRENGGGGGGSSSTTGGCSLAPSSSSGGCTGNVWLYLDYVAYNVFTANRDGTAGPTGDYTYSKGDSNYMVTVPSTATGCISTASFSARNSWVDINGVTQYENQYDTTTGGTGTTATGISLYSSLGPGAGSANTQKPDIAAPGEPIISTLAASAASGMPDVRLGDATHVKLEGTSMASPFVAGVVALLFQKDATLTAAEIKTALTGNVITDSYTGSSLPNYTWGYGKVDALAAINSIE